MKIPVQTNDKDITSEENKNDVFKSGTSKGKTVDFLHLLIQCNNVLTSTIIIFKFLHFSGIMIALGLSLLGVLILIICLIICICMKNRNQEKAITPLNVVSTYFQNKKTYCLEFYLKILQISTSCIQFHFILGNT